MACARRAHPQIVERFTGVGISTSWHIDPPEPPVPANHGNAGRLAQSIRVSSWNTADVVHFPFSSAATDIAGFGKMRKTSRSARQTLPKIVRVSLEHEVVSGSVTHEAKWPSPDRAPRRRAAQEILTLVLMTRNDRRFDDVESLQQRTVGRFSRRRRCADPACRCRATGLRAPPWCESDI